MLRLTVKKLETIRWWTTDWFDDSFEESNEYGFEKKSSWKIAWNYAVISGKIIRRTLDDKFYPAFSPYLS